MRILKAVALLAIGVSAAAAAVEPDFAPIFNGRDLDGWAVMGKPEGFAVADGVLLSEGGKGGKWIRSTKEYGNFILRLEWMLSTNGNSGILIRTGEKGTGGGFEVQLLAPRTPPRDDLHCTGSIYGHVAVDPRPDETPNRWREMEIACRYKEIRVALDGQVVCRADMDQVESLRNRSLRGYVGMQDSHGAAGQWVKFRNIRIRDLDREPAFLLTGLRSNDRVIRDLAKAASVKLGAPIVGPLLDLMSEGRSKPVSTAEEALFAVVADASVPGDENRRRDVAGALAEQMTAAASDRARAYAARMLGLVGGGEVAIAELVSALQDPATREAARGALERTPGDEATQALLAALPRVAPEVRPDILHSLGVRRDPSAIGALTKIAAGPDGPDRVAAVEALGRIGDFSASQVVVDAASEGPEPLRDAAVDAMLALGDAQRERGEPFALRCYRWAWDNAVRPPQRTAALVGLNQIGAPGLLHFLFEGLAEQHSRPTAYAILAKMSDEELSVPLERELDGARGQKLAMLLRLGSERGLPRMEDRLVSAVQGEDDVAKATALELLAADPKPEQAPLFLSAMESESEPVKEAAAPGCLSIADAARSAGRPSEAASGYQAVLEHTTDAALLRRALAGLAALGDPQLAPSVAKLLGNAAVRQEAGQAYLALADAAAKAGQKETAIEAYTTLVTSEPLLNAGSAAGERLRELGIERSFAAELGFVSKWWIIGPFPNPDQSAYEKAFFPEKEINLDKEYEQDGHKLKWIAHETKSAHGVVELLDLFPGAQNVACYAYAEVESDAEREVLLKFGTDDGFALWLNGERLAGNPAGRALTVDQDTVKAKLREGKNTILLKVLQGGSRWAFCLRVTNPQANGLALPQRAPR